MEASGEPADRHDDARASVRWVPFLVVALGLAGGGLLVAAELSTVVTIDVLTTGTCEELAGSDVRDACKVDGLEQHGGALILLGLTAVLMALGAGGGRSRPAALALLAIAALVIFLALVRDFPKTDDTGLIGLRYEQANASPSAGLYLELAGAALCAAAGALALTRR